MPVTRSSDTRSRTIAHAVAALAIPFYSSEGLSRSRYAVLERLCNQVLHVGDQVPVGSAKTK